MAGWVDSRPVDAARLDLNVAKPAIEGGIHLSAPLSIGAMNFGAHLQGIENQGLYFEHCAAKAHGRKSPATFACRLGVDQIQPAASGKWGEVPGFDISRIEMTNV
jgi:hypothetical protein